MNSQKLWNIGTKSALAINIIREWNLLTIKQRDVAYKNVIQATNMVIY